jgi:hypothetical protein
MTKYCDVHGAVEVSGLTGDQVCPMLLDGNTTCGTVLKATPEALARRLGVPGPAADPIAGTTGQGQPKPTPNARDEDGKRMRQGAFLAAYGKTGRISKAAEIADVDRCTHYDWLKNDPAYSRAFDESKRLAFQHLADEAWRRAMGADGSQASDRLMIKLLESLGPATGNPEYGPAIKHEHSTAPGRPLEMNVSASELLHSRITSLLTGTPTEQAS